MMLSELSKAFAVFQIVRIQARQQTVRLFAPSRLTPELGESDGGAQFECLRLLPSSDCWSVLERYLRSLSTRRPHRRRRAPR